jgi:hypothetical protein
MMKAVISHIERSSPGYEKITAMTLKKDIVIDLVKAGEHHEGELVRLEYVAFCNAWKITKETA